jgi:hemin uptake protein HemP
VSADHLTLRLSLNTLQVMDQKAGQNPAPPTEGAAKPVPPVTVETATLFNGRDEIRLLHRGQEYRLRVTKQGKLILTK